MAHIPRHDLAPSRASFRCQRGNTTCLIRPLHLPYVQVLRSDSSSDYDRFDISVSAETRAGKGPLRRKVKNAPCPPRMTRPAYRGGLAPADSALAVRRPHSRSNCDVVAPLASIVAFAT